MGASSRCLAECACASVLPKHTGSVEQPQWVIEHRRQHCLSSLSENKRDRERAEESKPHRPGLGSSSAGVCTATTTLSFFHPSTHLIPSLCSVFSPLVFLLVLSTQFSNSPSPSSPYPGIYLVSLHSIWLS